MKKKERGKTGSHPGALSFASLLSAGHQLRAGMASGADMGVGDLQKSVCWWSRKAILKLADSQRADKTIPSLSKL